MRSSKHPSARGPASRVRSVLVVLDGVDVTRLGGVRILAEFALRAALAQQVPALVELLGNRLQALGIRLGAGGVLAQLVLLVDEGGDLVEDRLVIHGSKLLWHAKNRRAPPGA